MIERVISGGQTGADRIAWRVAQSLGIATGGAMLWGFRAEDGRHRDFAQTYGAHQLPTITHAAHFLANVRDSDGTIWIGSTHTLTGKTVLELCERIARPCLVVHLDAEPVEPSEVVRWIVAHNVRTLNVAGNRESVEPAITERAEELLREVFTLANQQIDKAQRTSQVPESSAKRFKRNE